MPWPSLVLWMTVFPLAAAIGLIALLGVYLALRPRERDGWDEIAGEGWRALAVIAGLPAFLLGAELALWAGLLVWRAPLVHTAIADRLGWTLLIASPIPVVAYLVWGQRPLRRPARATAIVAALGLALVVLGPLARGQAVRALVARSGDDSAAFERLMLLVGYRYVDAQTALPAVDAALAGPDDVLGYALAAREGAVPMTAEVRDHLARRLFDALAAAPEPLGDRAVPAIAWLTGDGGEALRAFALADPALRQAALAGDVDVQTVLAAALARGGEDARIAVMNAAYAATNGVPLRGEAIAALAGALDASEPVGDLATRMLLRDASSTALRHVVTRFNDPQAPEWQLLLDDCPRQVAGLERLEGDADADVASGASALRGYVRQYCRLASQTQG